MITQLGETIHTEYMRPGDLFFVNLCVEGGVGGEKRMLDEGKIGHRIRFLVHPAFSFPPILGLILRSSCILVFPPGPILRSSSILFSPKEKETRMLDERKIGPRRENEDVG